MSFPEDVSVGDASARSSSDLAREGAEDGSETDGGGGGGGHGQRIPRTDVMRTSTKFVAQGDAEGGASWDEEFFFPCVAGETAVRIVCIDKVEALMRFLFRSGSMIVCVCLCVFLSLFVVVWGLLSVFPICCVSDSACVEWWPFFRF